MKQPQYYWKIETPNDVIWAYADHITVTDGCLCLYSVELGLIISFSKGNWIHITPASCIDGGHATCIEHWDKKIKHEVKGL